MHIVIIGANITGLTCAWHLINNGVDVTVIDKGQGITTGHSRINDGFNFLASTLQELDRTKETLLYWKELEDLCGIQLLSNCGSIEQGDSASIGFRTALLDQANIAVEILSNVEASYRWPGFEFNETTIFIPASSMIHKTSAMDILAKNISNKGGQILWNSNITKIIDAPFGKSRAVLDNEENFEFDEIIITDIENASQILNSSGLKTKYFDAAVNLVHVHYPKPNEEFWPCITHYPSLKNELSNIMIGVSNVGYNFHLSELGNETIIPFDLDEDETSFCVDPFASSRLLDYVKKYIPGLDSQCSQSIPQHFVKINNSSKMMCLDKKGPAIFALANWHISTQYGPLLGKLAAELALEKTFSPLDLRL